MYMVYRRVLIYSFLKTINIALTCQITSLCGVGLFPPHFLPLDKYPWRVYNMLRYPTGV